MGWKLNGKDATREAAARAAKDEIYTCKIVEDGAELFSVTKYWKQQVFWACGYGVLIGLATALGVVVILWGNP